MTQHLILENISHQYGAKTTFQNISLQLSMGEIACLLGPSGCGKTTVLRAIAGFEAITQGQIYLKQTVLSNPQYQLAPEKRQIGMVFQDYALFPHLNVYDNIGFGLYKYSQAEKDQRIHTLLSLTELNEFAKKFPHELSGGQQQRVALARALAPKPQLLLMDEPFSNLDVTLREYLAKEVREILKRENMTALIVTHDQQEAFTLADQIAVMQNGKIEQVAEPYHLYHHPINPNVAKFIGQGSFLRGCVDQSGYIQTELGILHPHHHFKDTAQNDASEPILVDVFLRPDDIVHDDHSPLQATIIAKTFCGANFLYLLRLGSGQEVLSLVPSHHNHDIGQAIGIVLAADHVVAYPVSAAVHPRFHGITPI